MIVPHAARSRKPVAVTAAVCLILAFVAGASSTQTAGAEPSAEGIPGLEIVAEPSELATGAGREEQVDLTFTNSGNATLDLVLHAREVVPANDPGRPSGLQFRFEEDRIEVAPGTSRVAELAVIAPENASMRDTSILVTAVLETSDPPREQSVELRARVFGAPDPARTYERGLPSEERKDGKLPVPMAGPSGAFMALALALALTRRS